MRAAIVQRLIADWSADPDLTPEKTRHLAMWAGASVRSLFHEMGTLRDMAQEHTRDAVEPLGSSAAIPNDVWETLQRLPFAIAQLRHAYAQLIGGHVHAKRQFADGLIAPQIQTLEQVDAALALLHQQQAEPCVWRDIASAPKDGTELLLLEGRRVVSGAWNSGGAFHMPHWMGGNYHPTHWMFIPSDHLQVAKPCVWREVDSHYGLWSPACVNSAEALHNSWKYCPYCSHPLQVQRP